MGPRVVNRKTRQIISAVRAICIGLGGPLPSVPRIAVGKLNVFPCTLVFYTLPFLAGFPTVDGFHYNAGVARREAIVQCGEVSHYLLIQPVPRSFRSEEHTSEL